jgi:hypothetical protein
MAEIYFDVDTALSEVPVNIFPLTDDTDFKTRETSITYNQAGMDLVWNFVTTAGAFTQTAVTPTTGGNYDWTHQGDGMYTIEIPASGGASINNDAEGFGWFTGIATGVLPWRSPIFCFRASGINDKLIDSAYSTTRGLSGTSLPDAAADAAGGLPISDAGGLDIDTLLSTLTNATYGLSAIETLVDELETRLTATRAGYLDNLSSAPPSAATIADAVLDEALSGHQAVGTAGIALTDTLGYVTALRSALTDLRAAALDRIVGTIAAGTHNPQSGDAYSVVNNGTYGNSAIKTLIDALPTAATIATTVWAAGTRTLTSFGSLVADTATAVWGAVARTITGGTVDTCTTNSDMRGTDSALLAANYTAPNNSGITDIKDKTDQLTFTTPNKVDATATVSVAGLATEAKQDEIITDIAGVITHGDSNWLTPSGIGGTIAITFNVKDDSGNNILDAVVEVCDTAGTTLKERKETNSNGNSVFNCKAETYTIKITKSGYSFTNVSYTVTVPATVNYVMTAFVIPVSPDLTKCRVWMKLINTYASLTVTADVPENLTGNNLVMGNYTGVYDTVNNLVYWDLPIGALNSVLKITELGFEVVVPLILDLESVELKDLI